MIPLTAALWLHSLATGILGTRTSRIITCSEEGGDNDRTMLCKADVSLQLESYCAYIIIPL